ncbi:hypothetical protein I317_03303 [Kwoniella heveanensis CBS 569]|nr:hypothetical protein I317_03303 [Kwoniella heveanensis CBS 569]
MFLALSLFPLLLAIVVNAQTQAQIQACANSIRLTSYEAEPTWSTQDNTHHFNATYTYSPSDCLTPKEVPITRIYLANLNGPTYNCPKPPFDSTGVLYTECSQSLGTIAQAAKDGDADFNYVDPPQPSGAVARRRRALLGLQKECLPGYSFCPVGKGLSECIDTSTNLYGE